MNKFYFFIALLMLQLFTYCLADAQIHSITPDSTLGNNGVRLYTAGAYTSIAVMDVQADKKIIGAQAGSVTRLKYNGDVDSTFGNAGTALLTAYGPGNGMYAVKALPNGKTLVCASSKTVDGGGFAIAWTYFVAQLTANGIIDSTFGVNGYAVMTTEQYALPDMKVLSDGTIRYIYINPDTSNYLPVIVKLNSNGIRDNSFGTNGRIKIDSINSNGIGLFVLDNNDRLVVVGKNSAQKWIVGRILPNGSADNSFGTSGFTTINTVGTNSITQSPVGMVVPVAVNDNSVVIIMRYNQFSQAFTFAAHVNVNGVQDMAYGQGGLAFTGLGTNATAGYGLSLPNNEVLVAAELHFFDGGSIYLNHVEMMVLNTAGGVDSVFSGNAFNYVQYDSAVGNRYTEGGPVCLVPGSNQIVEWGSTQTVLSFLARYNYNDFVSGIKDSKSAINFQLYPQPANRYVLLNYKTDNDLPLNLKVYDINGKPVLEKTLSGDMSSYQLDCSTWAAGVYIVELRQHDQVSYKKLVLQR